MPIGECPYSPKPPMLFTVRSKAPFQYVCARNMEEELLLPQEPRIEHPRYFLNLSYDGTRYSGWQVQKNSPSVQQTINEAMQKLLRQPIRSTGCGRTDTGVHAKFFYMHVDVENGIADIPDFLFRLNCVLPDDIAIHHIIPVHNRAHARFDAFERTYEYYIYFDKSAYLRRFAAYQGFYLIDWEKVMEATDFLINIQDFTSLCLPSEDFKTNICYLKHIGWDVLPGHHHVHKKFEEGWYLNRPNSTPPAQGEVYRFTVTSNRFLRCMIRKIVGTALMVGKNKITMNEFKETVLNKETFKLHYLAAPNGLYLSNVKYPYIQEGKLVERVSI
mgnify:CR=1 FL=1